MLPWSLSRTPQISSCLSPPRRQICKLPHLCGNGREQERRKKEKNPPTCQQTGKKITQALSHSAVGLLLPPTVMTAPASWTGTWLRAVSLPILSWLLSILLPQPQLWEGGSYSLGVGKLEGKTDRATKCLWPTTNSVPITVPQTMQGTILPSQGEKSRSSLPPGNSSHKCCPLPIPFAASLYHFVFRLCFQSNSLYSNLFCALSFLHQFWASYLKKKKKTKMECVGRKGGLWKSSLLETVKENRGV